MAVTSRDARLDLRPGDIGGDNEDLHRVVTPLVRLGLRSDDLDDTRLVGRCERRSGGQTQALVEDVGAAPGPHETDASEGGLEMQRLPRRPRLDVVSLQGQPHNLSVCAEDLGSIRMQVSQKFEVPTAVRGMKEMPGTSEKAVV